MKQAWQRDLIDLEDWAHNPLRWSDEMFRLLGYSVGEVGASRADFDRVIHPEDRDRILELMSAAIRERRPYNTDYRIILPNGTERYLYSQADIVYDEKTKKPSKIVGVVQDVTDQKRSEQELTVAMDGPAHVAARWRPRSEHLRQFSPN